MKDERERPYLYFLLVIGNWKFENWHLYRDGWTCSVKKPSNRWRVWRKIF